MLHIFFSYADVVRTGILMIRLPRALSSCSLLQSRKWVAAPSPPPNMVHGDNNIQTDSLCTQWQYGCDVPLSRLQPDWMSWFYLRWFIMLLDIMHRKQDPLLSVSQYHGLTLDTTLFTLFSFPILIYVAIHRGKWREAERDEGLIGPAEEGYTWGKLRAVNKWRKLKGNIEGLIECFELDWGSDRGSVPVVCSNLHRPETSTLP